MSKKRHTLADDGLLVRTYAVTHPPNLDIGARSMGHWDQLAYASRGVMNVRTQQGDWVVPPHRAVWIPAGVTHSVQMTGRVALRTLFFARNMTRRRMPRRCRAVNVPPLMRELILHATRVGMLRRDQPRHVRLAGVIIDQLETLAANPLQVPLPKDPRARRAADKILAAPGDAKNLDTLARQSGASRRTLERLFVDETGMTLGRWRQRARLVEALRLLASGEPVNRVAWQVGYTAASAFIAAFRQELGTTPKRYFGSPL